MSESYIFDSMIGSISASPDTEGFDKLKKLKRDNEKFYRYNVEGLWYSVIKCAVYRIASKTLLVGSYEIPKPLEEGVIDVGD